jgi:hypothetical protein
MDSCGNARVILAHLSFQVALEIITTTTGIMDLGGCGPLLYYSVQKHPTYSSHGLVSSMCHNIILMETSIMSSFSYQNETNI